MARQGVQQANKTYNTESALTGTSEGNAAALYGQLNPFYQHEVTNPQGMTPEDYNAAQTAVRQSTGGSTAGAVGAGNLEAARTRNSAGITAGEDAAAREATRTGADEALQLRLANSRMRQQQQQAGLEGEQGLFNTENADVLSSLGFQPAAINAGTTAGANGWFQNFLGTLNAGANVAKGVAALNQSGNNG